MKESNTKISLSQIEATFKERSWWAIVFNLYPAKYITYYLVNKTNITPNQVTTVSLLFAVFAGVAFYYAYFVAGAILYQISYTLDIVDGSVARSKHLSSRIGAFYDVMTDWLKAPLLFMIVFQKFEALNLLLVLYFLLFIGCLVSKYNDMLYFQGAKSISLIQSDPNSENMKGVFKYIQKAKEKNIQPFPSSVEVEGLLLFFYPITALNMFVYLAFSILFFNMSIKIYAILKKLK